MNQRIYRPFDTPKREGISWEKRWEGEDKGLITCWEVGRDLREQDKDLASRAEHGELPALDWKGGIEEKIKKGEKYGTLYYLAQLQGLKGEDLNIDLSNEPILICTRTGVRITYTGDLKKYGHA